MTDAMKMMSFGEREERRAVAVKLLQEAGAGNADLLVDLHLETATAERDNDQVTTDPVTGNSFTALQLMDQLESEGKDRLGREFSERRGYSNDEINLYEQYVDEVMMTERMGTRMDDISYALGVADGNLDMPEDVRLSLRGGEQPAVPASKPSELSGEALRVELRNAMARLNDIEDGRTARYDDVERSRLAQLAKAAMLYPAPGLGSSLSPLQQMAQGVVNSMAAIDGAKADNPFMGSKLSGTYATAQRWQAHLARHNERPSLQALLNARAELVSAVDREALAMHEAQRIESTAFALKGVATDGADNYQAAFQKSREATERFAQAVTALREFRNAPTADPQLRRTFQDLEALELVVSKTEQSIRDATSAGMQPDELDHRELRHNQMALKAFLQQHDATIPMNTPANAERRQERHDNRATTAHRM